MGDRVARDGQVVIEFGPESTVGSAYNNDNLGVIDTIGSPDLAGPAGAKSRPGVGLVIAGIISCPRIVSVSSRS